MSENKVICSECGKENKKGSIMCCNCGKVLQNDLAQARLNKTYPKYNFTNKIKKKQLSSIVGLILCIFLIGTIVYINSKSSSEGTENVSSDLSAILLENDNSEETMTNQGYFYNFRAEKAKSYTDFKKEMNSIIEDTTSSQEVKDTATDLLNEKIQLQEQESVVETEIMNNGYEDAVCMIDSDIVRVYVKVNDTLSKENATTIQKLVEDVTGLTDIQIEARI